MTLTPADDVRDRLKVRVVVCRKGMKSPREHVEKLHHMVSGAMLCT